MAGMVVSGGSPVYAAIYQFIIVAMILAASGIAGLVVTLLMRVRALLSGRAIGAASRNVVIGTRLLPERACAARAGERRIDGRQRPGTARPFPLWRLRSGPAFAAHRSRNIRDWRFSPRRMPQWKRQTSRLVPRRRPSCVKQFVSITTSDRCRKDTLKRFLFALLGKPQFHRSCGQPFASGAARQSRGVGYVDRSVRRDDCITERHGDDSKFPAARGRRTADA
jgi:hypothetical protein